MSEARTTLLRRYGFGFFGSVTASLSHEINNVLATINELSGLLADLLQEAEKSGGLDPARLQRPVGRIAAQVRRGEGYVKQLNRFAHSVDEGCTRLDLGAIIAEVVGLSQRFARLKKVTLAMALPETACHIEGDPFEWRQIVFRCIQLGLGVVGSGSSLLVGLESLDGRVRLKVSGEEVQTETEATKAQRSAIALLAQELGATLEEEVAVGQALGVAVVLPLVSNGPAAHKGDKGSD